MQRQERINEALRNVDTAFRAVKSSKFLNTHNTEKHEMAKCKVAYLLQKQGCEVYLEIVFRAGGRADIFVPERGEIYEICYSEKSKRREEKKKKYPWEFMIYFLEADEVLKEGFEL